MFLSYTNPIKRRTENRQNTTGAQDRRDIDVGLRTTAGISADSSKWRNAFAFAFTAAQPVRGGLPQGEPGTCYYVDYFIF